MARAAQLESTGVDVVHLELGQLTTAAPAALEAGIRAITEGRNTYTTPQGLPDLRSALSASFLESFGVPVPLERIVITTGSSAALLLALASLLDTSDELLVPDPGYPCYSNIARAIGSRVQPVRVRANERFAFDMDDVSRHVNPGAKVILVNSPSNPTGAVTPLHTFQEFSQLGLTIVADEVYSGLTFDGHSQSVLQVNDSAWVAGGFSKRYGLTGWRVGYLVVPEGSLETVLALQQNLYISAPQPAQWAALGALAGAHSDDLPNGAELGRRCDYLATSLTDLGFTIPAYPVAGFYLWVDARAFTTDCLAFTYDILERCHVAVAPGVDFGRSGKGFLRFAFTEPWERIEEGVRRLRAYLVRGSV